MKYPPKKVYLLEDGGYVEISYQELCTRRELEPSYAGKHFIPIQGMLLEVPENIYSEFYQEKERSDYLAALDQENGLLSLDVLLESGSEIAFASFNEEIEDLVADRLMRLQLHKCLRLLSEKEQKLIQLLYFNGLTERQAAKLLHISHVAVHKQKHRILDKLKKLLKN